MAGSGGLTPQQIIAMANAGDTPPPAAPPQQGGILGWLSNRGADGMSLADRLGLMGAAIDQRNPDAYAKAQQLLQSRQDQELTARAKAAQGSMEQQLLPVALGGDAGAPIGPVAQRLLGPSPGAAAPVQAARPTASMSAMNTSPAAATAPSVSDPSAAQRRAQVMLSLLDPRMGSVASIAGLGLDPREQAVALSNPQEWAKESASRYGFHSVPGGDTMINGPNGPLAVAPKLTGDAGQFFTQTPTGTSKTGERGPTPQEAWEREKPLVMTSDQTAFDPVTHQPIMAPEKLQEVDPGKDLYQRPALGGQPAAAGAPAGAGAPRGLRNNNPLNLKTPPGGAWPGQTGVDADGYATFASPDAGWASADANLRAYAVHHGIDTVQGVVARWAPQSDGNDPAAYAATVSHALGVAPDARLDLSQPAVRHKLLQAMAGVETPGAAPAAAAPAGVAQPGGFHLVRPAADDQGLDDGTATYLAEKFNQTGQLPAMGTGKIGSLNRAIVLKKAAGLDGAQGLTGGDAVRRQAKVKAAMGALDNLSKVQAITESAAATAADTGQLIMQLSQKGAGPSGSPILNRWIQYGRKEVAGDPDVSAFDNVISTFATEYAKAIAGGTGNEAVTDSARADARDRLSKYAAKGQLSAGINVMNQEIAIRRHALDRESESLAESIGGRPAAGKPSPAGAPPADRLKEGVQTTFANGQTWQLTGGRPVRVH